MPKDPDYAKAGARWTDDEDMALMKKAFDGMKLSDIASMHKRTERGVKLRIMTNALKNMQENGKSLDETAKLVHISVDELKEYWQKQKQDEIDRQPWTNTMDDNLLNDVKNGESIFDIACKLQRSENSVKVRVLHHALEMMCKRNLTAEQVSVRLGVSVHDIEQYKKKVIKSLPKNDDKYMEILTEIRDLIKLLVVRT